MLKFLKRIAGLDDKAEAQAAQKSAQRSLEAARARTDEIAQLTDRMRTHGVVNHIGERVEAAWRGV